MFTTFCRGREYARGNILFLAANMPLSMNSFSALTPSRHPSAPLSLLMMSLPFLSHQRNSFMVLAIAATISTAQSVGPHLECLTQKAVRLQTLLSHQQNSNSCLRHTKVGELDCLRTERSDRHRGFILRDWASDHFLNREGGAFQLLLIKCMRNKC